MFQTTGGRKFHLDNFTGRKLCRLTRPGNLRLLFVNHRRNVWEDISKMLTVKVYGRLFLSLNEETILKILCKRYYDFVQRFPLDISSRTGSSEMIRLIK